MVGHKWALVLSMASGLMVAACGSTKPQASPGLSTAALRRRNPRRCSRPPQPRHYRLLQRPLHRLPRPPPLVPLRARQPPLSLRDDDTARCCWVSSDGRFGNCYQAGEFCIDADHGVHRRRRQWRSDRLRGQRRVAVGAGMKGERAAGRLFLLTVTAGLPIAGEGSRRPNPR